MENSEAVEKIRQEIMRFRELLTLMRGTLDDGERAYSALFSPFSPEALADMQALKEKGNGSTLNPQPLPPKGKGRQTRLVW